MITYRSLLYLVLLHHFFCEAISEIKYTKYKNNACINIDTKVFGYG